MSATRVPQSLINAPGQVAFYAMNTAPAGWLKANGAAISRTTYAALFAAIGTTFGTGDGSTTFNIPDLRGEFIRGWDDSRGVDSGRSFGSAQADEFESHTHIQNAHSHVERFRNSGGGSLNLSPTSNGTGTVSDTTVSTGDTTATNQNTGGVETRPRNVAFLGCIKY